jgi:ATP-binding cassette subfamily C protein
VCYEYNESISDAQINEALKTAQLSSMIEGMPDVVIFDESTSALDVHTEVKLYAELEPILKDKTVITIAHRLSTVKGADMIYVLDEGKVVQAGTHKELEAEEGHYMEFVKKQLI